jgi:hypothetical protein
MDVEPFYFKNLAYVKSKVSSTTLEEIEKMGLELLENEEE